MYNSINCQEIYCNRKNSCLQGVISALACSRLLDRLLKKKKKPNENETRAIWGREWWYGGKKPGDCASVSPARGLDWMHDCTALHYYLGALNRLNHLINRIHIVCFEELRLTCPVFKPSISVLGPRGSECSSPSPSPLCTVYPYTLSLRRFVFRTEGARNVSDTRVAGDESTRGVTRQVSMMSFMGRSLSGTKNAAGDTHEDTAPIFRLFWIPKMNSP